MNLADTAIAEGNAVLLDTAGDTVIFRGVSVSAVIDWMPKADSPNGQFPNFSTQATSRIELTGNAFGAVPKAGETIQSDGPRYHRIQSVRWNGYAWLCDCEVVP